MKVVVVTQRIDILPERNEIRDALDQRLVFFLSSCGFIPMPVPNSLGNLLSDWLTVVKPAAIVLSGGGDVGQNGIRDETELALLIHAQKCKLPVLGICRGMQMLAYWAGMSTHPVSGHICTRHRLTGKISTVVNSYHRYSLTSCPEGFEVLARSQDGEIEAIRHQQLPWEGWMWHPEREEYFANNDQLRIKVLFGG